MSEEHSQSAHQHYLEEQDVGLTTHRLDALVDGIFAISMTILVLALPMVGGATAPANDKTGEMLISQLHTIYIYILSFINLAVFWIIHHQQSHFIKHTDRTHIWLNIIFLMFIAIIPFSTALVQNYLYDWVDEVFFAMNFMMVGVMLEMIWVYATHNYRLVVKNLSHDHIVVGIRRGLVAPLTSIVAIIMAFTDANISSSVYLLVPVILTLPYFHFKKS